MPKLTITLDDQLHQALEKTAARRRRSIDSIVEECLRLRGIGTCGDAAEIVAKARKAARLTPNAANTLAVEEVRQLRRQKSA